nr:hypothetical protein [Bacilli bacterium]
MKLWWWMVRIYGRNHALGLVASLILAALWIESELSIWATGNLALTDMQTAIGIAGWSLSVPMIDVVFALWAALIVHKDMNAGMDGEMVVRNISLRKRLLPQLFPVAVSIILLFLIVSWLTIHGTILTVDNKGTSAMLWLQWGIWMLSMIAVGLFIFCISYYATILFRSYVYGTIVACVFPAGYSVLPMRFNEWLPGTSLMAWTQEVPVYAKADRAQLSSILHTHLPIGTGIVPIFIGIVLSGLLLAMFHDLAKRRRYEPYLN